MDVKLIGASRREALDMKKIQDRIVGQVISPAQVAGLGDRSIDEGYIYAPVSSDQKVNASTPSP